MSRRPRYTDFPRTILWLVPGGRTIVGGDEPDSCPVLEAAVEPFYLSKWPITNEQFEAFDPAFERAPHSPGDRDTAVGVSYVAAAEYCRWYAQVSRKPMRLPTEVEWEHACRAGATGRWYWGDDEGAADEHLLDARNWHGRLEGLDRSRGNGFGLQAMLGGVWEWTASPWRGCPLEDCRPAVVTTDPVATPEGARVLRGGSFRIDRSVISCSLRRSGSPDLRADDIGFRVAKSFR
ncbi:MAG TPA: SUMF1/EgtB/PvdO family nonheme iron enzyme [Thermoanaerobaculia bacterium]|nr:SUMF1/EgtB/PvdO family nonheme iron enzyme [Thermoanaerobaculia bacterium]